MPSRWAQPTGAGAHAMTGHPLVLLHGFMGSAATFDRIGQGLSREVFPVTIPHPDENRSETLSSAHDSMARQILARLDHGGIGRYAVLGYSMGGRLAMHMAALAPERVECMILESAHPGLETQQDREVRRQHDATWAHRIRTGWPNVLEQWYEQDVFASLSLDLRKGLITEKGTQDPDEAATVLEALSLGRQRSFWSELAGFPFPILFISGEMDVRYRQVGERLAGESGPIRHVSLGGAGHVVHREQPEAYLDALESFLSLESSPER